MHSAHIPWNNCTHQGNIFILYGHDFLLNYENMRPEILMEMLI